MFVSKQQRSSALKSLALLVWWWCHLFRNRSLEALNSADNTLPLHSLFYYRACRLRYCIILLIAPIPSGYASPFAFLFEIFQAIPAVSFSVYHYLTMRKYRRLSPWQAKGWSYSTNGDFSDASFYLQLDPKVVVCVPGSNTGLRTNNARTIGRWLIWWTASRSGWDFTIPSWVYIYNGDVPRQKLMNWNCHNFLTSGEFGFLLSHFEYEDCKPRKHSQHDFRGRE